MLHTTRLKRSIKQKIEQAGGGMQTVLVTRKDLDDLNDEIGQAAVNATGSDKKRLPACRAEGEVPAVPRRGERACPPEDCGGPWGYVDYLAAITDPKHEQHEEMRKWRGPFDPEAFDAKKATKEMKKIK